MEFPRKEAPLLNTNKELRFQVTDWYIPESDRNRPKPETPNEAEFYTIVIYGTTKHGHTVSARVTGYEPCFYIKPPESWEEYDDNKFKNEVRILKTKILNDKYPTTYNGKKYDRKITAYGYESHVVDIKMIKKKDFWGFSNNKEFRFIKIIVKSLFMFNNYKYYFDSLKKEGFKMYESNIDPFLRYIHERNIKPSGWVEISDYLIEDDERYETRCDYNVVVEHQNISPIDNNSFAPLLIASFDIECTSSHGDFPVPKKDYRKVVQDLALVARAGYVITEEFLLYWLQQILDGKDAYIDDSISINRVFIKNKKIYNFASYEDKIKKESKDIIKLLDEISNISEDADEDEDSKPMTVKQQNILEDKINSILTKILPKLEGDKIIQIGTTVHRYGSDKIVYKNLISLNSCNSICDVDVIQCTSEKQVLMEWKNLMVRLNPDVLTGYNIFGFDMEYIWERANENGISEELADGLGRNMSRKTTLTKQELTSSALGENILKYFDMDGTVIIDLLKVMQRDHKLDSYKLDNVAAEFIGDKKEDLKPNEIFQKFKGNADDRCIIAKYCIQDCALINRLIHKLKILENNIGMANVCLVPLNFLFKRGQGIKIFSLVAKQCMDKGYLIPTNKYSSEREMDMEGYEGAVVLEPKEGIYLNEPIVVFDYGSLYPSSMIARNLSHDCYVMDPKYMVDDPNIDYIKVTYDEYKGVGDKKEKIGVKECIFAQYKNGKKGVIPEILQMLLNERKTTRSKIQYETVVTDDGKFSGIVTQQGDTLVIQDLDTGSKTIVETKNVKKQSATFNKFEQDVLDALQSAYKVTANSLYGQIGARTSQIYLKDIAACTTATGREMIMLAKDYVETKYNAEVIYGDSVMPYTPLTYSTGDGIVVTSFEEFHGFWMPYNNFKIHDTDRYDKEQLIPNYILVWTHVGWARVKRIIRHRTTKKIYRVVTSTGVVDVTEDHSLLDNNVNIIKPASCVKGTKLLHSAPKFVTSEYERDEKTAYLYGAFIAGGNIYESCEKYIWEIKSANYDCLTNCQKIITDLGVESHIVCRNEEYVLTVMAYNNSFLQMFKCCYNAKSKIVPNYIINGCKKSMRAFKTAFDCICIEYVFDVKDQVFIQSFNVMLQMLCEKYILKVDGEKVSFIAGNHENDDIISIEVLHEKYHGYVYDIETERGVFHGGIGNLILKNTDSIFCKFPLTDKKGNAAYGKDSLPYAIEIGKHVEKNIVSIMPKPQKLNYEKTMYPFILFSKKRYVGNLYEMDVTKFKQKSMGIVLKRRDNAQIVKKIYGGIIDIILNKQDLKESLEFLREELSNLVQGKTPISDLIVSKSLRGSYKDPSKIPHKVLADRIGQRDPGNKPQVNDRVPYVYINVPNAKLQGEKIENPDYIVENNLVPDYLHYITNQIMNPVLQLYALCLEELPNYTEPVDYWIKIEDELKTKPMYQNDTKRKNRIENLRLKKVKELLFDEFIDMLSEPKIKKPRQAPAGKILNGADIEKEEKEAKERKKIQRAEAKAAKTVKKVNVQAPVAQNEKVKQNVENQDEVSNDAVKEELIATIKVVEKRTTKTIESTGYIMNQNKKDWGFKNDTGKDKISEIISIIVEMVEYAKVNKKKLLIDVNFAQFKKEYNQSLIVYKELEKNTGKELNDVQAAIDGVDVGAYKDVSKIFKYEKLIRINEYFTINK